MRSARQTGPSREGTLARTLIIARETDVAVEASAKMVCLHTLVIAMRDSRLNWLTVPQRLVFRLMSAWSSMAMITARAVTTGEHVRMRQARTSALARKDMRRSALTKTWRHAPQ
jgi:hypothetical protein